MEQETANDIMKEALDMAKQLFADGRYSECKPVLTQYLKCKPQEIEEALMHYALSCHQLGQNDEALKVFDEMLVREDCSGSKGDIYNNMSVVHSSVGRFDKAIECLEEALKIEPEKAVFWANIGVQYRHKREYDKAIENLLKSVELMPEKDKMLAVNNLGSCYSENFQLEEGEKWYRKNIEKDDQYSVSHVDLAYNLMLQDRWEEAWTHHNWRFNHFKQLQRFKELDDSEKRWDGNLSLEGKTYLLYCEQGVGDILMYARYIPILKSLGCKIVFYCYERLVKLFENIEEIDEIIELEYNKELIELTKFKEENLVEHDFNSSILSLPYLLKKYDPFYDKYLDFTESADLSSYEEDFKIGVIWAGSPLHPDDSRRSCYLKEFASIANIPGVKLFNLQKDTRPRKYAYKEQIIDYTEDVDFNLVDCSEYFDDFEALAKFINSVDLLISVDTAPIHLAGMLERPAWMLTAYNADPRWGKNMCRVSDWYPTVKAYQQKERGGWTEVLERVAKDVKSLLSDK
jgi:Tfp pilus assembly protein PilF